MQRWTGGKKQKKKKGNVLEYCYLVDARSIRRVGLRSEVDQYQLESGGLTCRLEVVDSCGLLLYVRVDLEADSSKQDSGLCESPV